MGVIGDLPALILAELASGSTDALLALGVVIAFRSTDAINFAIGHIGALAVCAATAVLPPGLPVAALPVGTVLPGGLIGGAARRAVVRPIARGANVPFGAPVAALGLSFVIHAAVGAVCGHPSYRFPALVPGAVAVGGFALAWNEVPAAGCALVATACAAPLFGRSPPGVGMRASAEDRFAARLVGLDPRRIADPARFVGRATGASAHAETVLARGRVVHRGPPASAATAAAIQSVYVCHVEEPSA